MTTDDLKITVPAQQIARQRRWAPGFHRLYWAYGSNLSRDHMRRRCPDARPIRSMELNHAQLVFRGVADVTLRRRAAIPGGLWLITPECERSLDQYEGVASKVYLRRFVTVRIEGGAREGEYEVLFYQMRTHRGVMPPSEAYLRTIERGYQDFGLDLAYLDDALSRSWEQKDLTEEMRDRQRRRGHPRWARPGPAPFELSDDDIRLAGGI